MSSPTSSITAASGSQYTTQSIGTTIDENSHENRDLLAHGTAADIWLIHTLNQAPTTCVSKIIRLSEDVLHRNCNRKSQVDVKKLWNEFLCDFQRRVAQWSPIRHINVIRVFELKEELDLRVEYCPNGTASQYLKGLQTNRTEAQSRMIMDIVQGVTHLHSQDPPIVHGSINLNKVFVSADGTTKIGEFGLTVLTNHFAFLAPTIFRNELYRWMSPEIIGWEDDDKGPMLTTASDIWALGCTLFEIISEKLPYHKFKYELRVCAEILSGRLPGEPSLSLGLELERAFSNLKLCWEFQPGHRPSATELTRFFSPHPLGPATTGSLSPKKDTTDKHEAPASGKELTFGEHVAPFSPLPLRCGTPPITPQRRRSLGPHDETSVVSRGVDILPDSTSSHDTTDTTDSGGEDPPISPASDFSLLEESKWEPEYQPQFRGRRDLDIGTIKHPYPQPWGGHPDPNVPAGVIVVSDPRLETTPLDPCPEVPSHVVSSHDQ